MDSEELEELSACYHLPTDDPLVKEFYGMDEKDKIKSIVLGVDLLKHGRNRLITFEGDEIINNLKKENDNLLNKLAENKLENQKYIETSNERQKNLIRDIKLAEEIRFKTEIEQTEKINAGLNEKLSNIHERLDEQYEKKLKNAVSIYKEQSICEKNRIKELEENFKSIHQELDIKNNQKITDTRNFYENK